MIHCFTGTPDDARAYAAMGCYVSFSGIVTYKTAQPLRDAVPLVPRDRLLIETDCPYLAPVPMRGKRNEPAFVVHTAEVVAAVRGLSFEDLARDHHRECRTGLPAHSAVDSQGLAGIDSLLVSGERSRHGAQHRPARQEDRYDPGVRG